MPVRMIRPEVSAAPASSEMPSNRTFLVLESGIVVWRRSSDQYFVSEKFCMTTFALNSVQLTWCLFQLGMVLYYVHVKWSYKSNFHVDRESGQKRKRKKQVEEEEEYEKAPRLAQPDLKDNEHVLLPIKNKQGFIKRVEQQSKDGKK